MTREDVVQGLIDYFRTEQWRRMLDVLEYQHPRDAHLHLHVDGCIDITSLDQVLTSYFNTWGWPPIRAINHMVMDDDMYVLHGIGPLGKPNWDLFCHWNPDAALVSAAGREGGCNLLLWGRHFMEEWYTEFDFRSVGLQEEQAVRDYFQTEHWETGLALAANRELVTHIHINVKTRVSPDVFERIALEDLKRRGWSIDWSYPTIYRPHGEELRKLGSEGPMAGYLTKVVFLAREPVQVPVDLAWKFDPNVIMAEDRSPRLRDDRPGYDAFLTSELHSMEKAHPWFKLTEQELQTVAEALSQRHNRARAWQWAD